MKLETITPKMAQTWLDASARWAKEHPGEKNRPVSQRRVRRLAATIEAGEWQTTNQGIMLGRGNIVIDGQHRLTAIVEAGIACQAWVLRRSELTSPLNVPVDIDGASRGKHWVLGLRRQDYEVANMILEFAGTPPHHQTLKYHGAWSAQLLSDLSEYVATIGITAYKTRVLAQVPVRVGMAIAWHRQPEAVEQYAALVAQQHGTMWPVVGSLGSQLMAAMLKGQRMQRMDVLVRAWKAFSASPAARERRFQLGRHDAEKAHRAALVFLEGAGIDVEVVLADPRHVAAGK
jgi:hypothetical protein